MNIFELKSNLDWLNRIPTYIQDVFVNKLVYKNCFNEIHNTFKRRWFKRDKKLIKAEYVGIWGWNSWCGIHTFPLLTTGKINQLYKNTVDVGFKNTEDQTGLLPHAVLHKNGGFANNPTYRCYGGANNESYNLDNILCWAKMAMEYALISNDWDWFDEYHFKTVCNTIDYILTNLREKYNPKLVYTGIEGDWTECTNWELDNANVTVNLLRSLKLANECQIVLGKDTSPLNYAEIFDDILIEFNKPIKDGGLWHQDFGFYIHGNDGKGEKIHGDQYFESTANYFSILWDLASEEHKERIISYLDKNSQNIEFPYPVLTNYLPRTGARRKNYGKTVTNGDIWLVLGAHAAAARIKSGSTKVGSEMYKQIVQYEIDNEVFHNCIYQNGQTNDSWDPEVANNGAPFAPFVYGILGLNLKAEGIEFTIQPLTNLTKLETTIFVYTKPLKIKVKWGGSKHNSISNTNIESFVVFYDGKPVHTEANKFIIPRSL
ncbi:MAG: hypothetical protein GF364_15935 [Candidatus Lokiarchaeota archaeon]|nr:hypothetical protein [Candidatus Lokiarchaeota archaeon]